MLRYLILLLVLAVAGHGQSYAELRSHLVAEEGYRLTPYTLRGVVHTGIGHRIYGRVKARYTPNEIERLFAKDLQMACDAAYSGVRTFSRHPKDVRIMLVSLAYSTGPTGFHRFREFRRAIDRFDYRTAQTELRMSNWANQLPARSDRYVLILGRHIK
jgi:GH24 family phage-related lysozyme (muramidase)